MPKLGVNIDHVATLRQARREFEPDPIAAAAICEKAGADSIVCHLREDRRHINENDVRNLRRTVRTYLNLEMSLNKEIILLTAKLKPDQATIVPEKRQEITTEGGLDVKKHFRKIKEAAEFLTSKGIAVSLFIDPDQKQIDESCRAGVNMIELHTGQYAAARTKKQLGKELKIIDNMTRYATQSGLVVNAGHGLKYDNTRTVSKIKNIAELNIGHSIISRAVFVGLEKAVKEMRRLV
ncbi:MAG: pyridoxine 5'-phosphate synthase [Candidatus Omnitrophica bacterium]|nr:pyridoxine 5'-phosphate synthase [Candidatus Omnitrophota bacterium]